MPATSQIRVARTLEIHECMLGALAEHLLRETIGVKNVAMSCLRKRNLRIAAGCPLSSMTLVLR